MQKQKSLTKLIGSNAAFGLLNNDIAALGELVNQIKELPDVNTVFIIDHNFVIRVSNDSTYFNRIAMDSWSQKIHKEFRSTQADMVQIQHDGVTDSSVTIRIG